jgi:transposase
MGVRTRALLAVLDTACQGIDELADAVEELFSKHCDYGVITSFPGLGVVTGARVLAEIGDDRARFNDARALKAYAGSAPVARASGRSHVVLIAASRTTVWRRSAIPGRSWP